MADALIKRLEAVAARLEKSAHKLAPAGGDDEKSVAVLDYDAYYASSVQPFINTCNQLGAVDKVGKATETAFTTLRKVVEATGKCKKPSDAELMDFVSPIVNVVSNAQNVDNRSPNVNHEKAFAECIQLMNWLFGSSPSGVITGALEASEFYLNKILSAAKDLPDPDKTNHRAFVSGIKNLVNNLVDFVKNNFRAGLVWNPKGVSIKEFSSGAAAGGAPAAPEAPAGVPPPPPVLDASPISAEAPAAAGPAKPVGGLAAVFSEINKGDAITSGLKHVTKDMKTKNMANVPVLEAKTPAPAAAPKVAAVAEKKPPKVELRQGTWFIENYESAIKLEDAQMKQSVYVLKCNNCVVTIPDKVKSIQVDSCSKTTIVFGSVVSTFEIVNGKRITAIANEQLPSISVDKSSGVQIVISKEAMKAPPNIITSCATEVNVVIPGATDEADPIELPVSEQFLTVVKDGKLITESIKHSAN